MLFEALLENARRHPQEIAVHDDYGAHAWGELAAAATGLSRYLAAQTDRPHIGIMLPPGGAFVASFYGTLLAGRSVVPMNYLLGEREIQHVIQDSGLDTVVSAPPLAARLKDLPLKIVDVLELPRSPAVMPPPTAAPRADDLAVLMYTSGTSGLPKGVMLTYNNLQSDVDACIEHADLRRQLVFLGIIPLFHAFGMTATMLAPVQLGAKVVYMSRFAPAAALEAIRRHGVSIVFGVPSMYAAMLRLESASPADFRDMFALISGGEALPEAVRTGFERRLGATIHEGYGLTETSPVVSLNTPTDHRPGSVGRPVPGARVQVADDDGTPLPAGGEGEVWIRGPMVMRGYYNLPRETAAVFTPDGFFRTGDVGRIDGDGYLYITGRKKDIIICAGEKVSPREIEDVLARHPGVAEAAVVGRKDDIRGEAAVAFVVPHAGAAVDPEGLRRFCREQGLPTFKVPRDVVIAADLPRSPTGKLLKRVLAQMAAQRPA